MIGVLYICTGKYKVFWKDFFISAEKFFLPSGEKKYFVFTDAEEIYGEGTENIRKVYQGFLGWPFDTLLRFDMFSKVQEELVDCEYLFFFNSNVLFRDFIGNDILPGSKNDGLVAVLHPGLWNSSPDFFPYERNIHSTAYIGYGVGEHYFMGGMNGGQSGAYLELIDTLKNNIIHDLKNEITAISHDESHLNRYLVDKTPLILNPSYGYPEGWCLPFKPIISIVSKSRFGGHDFLRGISESTF